MFSFSLVLLVIVVVLVSSYFWILHLKMNQSILLWHWLGNKYLTEDTILKKIIQLLFYKQMPLVFSPNFSGRHSADYLLPAGKLMNRSNVFLWTDWFKKNLSLSLEILSTPPVYPRRSCKPTAAHLAVWTSRVEERMQLCRSNPSNIKSWFCTGEPLMWEVKLHFAVLPPVLFIGHRSVCVQFSHKKQCWKVRNVIQRNNTI